MDRNMYDTEGGIRALLTGYGLEGLHKLRKVRHEAGYVRREELNEFLILGTFYADGCGNLGRSEVSLDDVKLGRDAFEDVVSRAGLFVMKNVRISTGFGPCLPPWDAKCEGCRRGWTLENVDDAVPVGKSIGRGVVTGQTGEAGLWRHRRCQKLALAWQARNSFSKMAKMAGFMNSPMDEIPNEYCRCDKCMPWSLLRTAVGDIRIGWRKQVISINWEDTGVALPDLFKEEDVTKNAFLVHAWSEAKAVRYLMKLRDALSAAKGRAWL